MTLVADFFMVEKGGEVAVTRWRHVGIFAEVAPSWHRGGAHLAWPAVAHSGPEGH